jgi:hypothetical protein
VHERLIPGGSVTKLKNHMLHYSFMNYSQVLQKIDRYSSASAEQAFAKGKRSSPLAAIGHGAWSFFRTYVIRLGFLDGPQGFSLALANAQGSYYRYMKICELIKASKADKGL